MLEANFEYHETRIDSTCSYSSEARIWTVTILPSKTYSRSSNSISMHHPTAERIVITRNSPSFPPYHPHPPGPRRRITTPPPLQHTHTAQCNTAPRTRSQDPGPRPLGTISPHYQKHPSPHGTCCSQAPDMTCIPAWLDAAAVLSDHFTRIFAQVLGCGSCCSVLYHLPEGWTHAASATTCFTRGFIRGFVFWEFIPLGRACVRLRNRSIGDFIQLPRWW